MKLKPLGNRVLMKMDKSETKTSGGIIIPDIAQQQTNTALIVEVGCGDGKDPPPVNVKAGQKVMYNKFAGTPVTIDEEEHLILNMTDIIALVE